MKRSRQGALRYLARSLVNSVARIEREPVVVVSAPRSGSTLLMEAIASIDGYTFRDQPLDFWRYHPRDLSRSLTANRFVDPDPGLLEAGAGIVKWAGQGGLRGRGPWRVWERQYALFPSRVVVKLLNGQEIIRRIRADVDGCYVVLVRHPGASAESARRQGWRPHWEPYLQCDRYVERYLGSELASEVRARCEEGEEIVEYCAEWALRYRPVLDTAEEEGWLVLAFEELVREPGEAAREVAHYVGEGDGVVADMEAALRSPSRTTDDDSRVKERRDAVLTSWTEEFGEAEVRRGVDLAAEILGRALYGPEPRYRGGGTD